MAGKKNQQEKSTAASGGKKAKASNKKSKFDTNYFSLPHPGWMISIPAGLWLLFVTTFRPESIPTFLGPLSDLAFYLAKNHPNLLFSGSVVTVVVHVLEAAVAGKICHDRGMTISATIKWVLSTFAFGFASLLLRLLPYKPDYKIV